MKTLLRALSLLAMGAILLAPAVQAQDINIVYPISVIEKRLTRDTFQILNMRGSRRENDRTSRATLAFPDSMVIVAKWAVAAVNGEVFNNVPRYELAAYEIQKLFLDEPDFVVPPTVLRATDLEWYQTVKPNTPPTFGKTRSVLIVLQYWLSAVTQDSVFDLKRFERDTSYARNLANLNLLTHLIKHNDANAGNVLVSTNSLNPRLFAVDNGVAFGGEESDRGTIWRNIRVPRVPAYTVERLRKITREDLERTVGVVAEYEIQNERLVPVEKTAILNRGQGVRRKDNRIQFGLTKLEIDGIEQRLKQLLRRIDGNKLRTF